MGVRRFRCALVITLVLMGLSAGHAFAAKDWYKCTVLKAGPTSTGTTVFLQLSHAATPPAFTGKFFRIDGTRGKEMLAVALAAMTSGMNILVLVDPVLEYPPVEVIYLTAD